MRTGHPDPDLRRHGNPAGADSAASQRWAPKSDSTRGCGFTSTSAPRATPADPAQPGQHHGKPRALLAEALNLDHYRMSRYCRTVDPRFLEQLNRRKPTTMADLADIWYRARAPTTAEATITMTAATICSTSRHLHQRHGRVPAFSNSMPRQRKTQRPSRRPVEELHPALPGAQPDGQDSATASPKPQQNENPKYAMRTWLLRLGFIGEEFETAQIS